MRHSAAKSGRLKDSCSKNNEYIYPMSKTINIEGSQVSISGSAKPVIVMLHGWPDTQAVWEAQVKFFSHHYTCVTFNLPGFTKGESRNWTLDAIMDRLHAIVQAVSSEEKVILMVHDWGCVFGYEYAMRHQEKVAAIIGVDIGDAASPEFIKTLKPQELLMIFGYQFTLALGWLAKSDRIHQLMAKALKAPAPTDTIHSGMGLPYAMKWLMAGGGMRLKNFEFNCPFFFAYGTKKPLMFHSKAWIDRLDADPQHRVEAFKSTHWVMKDQPGQFNDSVLEWLASLQK